MKRSWTFKRVRRLLSYREGKGGMAEARTEGDEKWASAAAGQEVAKQEAPGVDNITTNRLADGSDPLATALHSLFTSFTDVVQGELQVR